MRGRRGRAGTARRTRSARSELPAAPRPGCARAPPACARVTPRCVTTPPGRHPPGASPRASPVRLGCRREGSVACTDESSGSHRGPRGELLGDEATGTPARGPSKRCCDRDEKSPRPEEALCGAEGGRPQPARQEPLGVPRSPRQRAERWFPGRVENHLRVSGRAAAGLGSSRRAGSSLGWVGL